MVALAICDACQLYPKILDKNDMCVECKDSILVTINEFEITLEEEAIEGDDWCGSLGWVCPSCGEINNSADTSCPECGTQGTEKDGL